MCAASWQDRSKAKRDAISNLIPSQWRIADVATAEDQRDISGSYLHRFMDQQEIEITESSPEIILQRTTNGIWKAVDVIRAFAHRAALIHQHVHCLHEIFFEAGIEDAKELDLYFAKHGKPIGPLHGLPVSLKDQFHVRGVETSMGYVGWLGTFEGKTDTGKEKHFESEMVRELRNLGAVLYCKTSVPHTLMCGETVNNIIGYTFNPKNRLLSAGGSSGGEGALIGAKGSPLGFGTDIGGSIRIPAAFNGLFGIRPSYGRLPYEGMANSMDGQNSIPSVLGPLSSSIFGLRLALMAILSQKPWLSDPLVHEIPWRDQHEVVLGISKAKKSLSFAVLWDDGLVHTTPPVKRALQETVDAIKSNGHTVIDWKPPRHSQGLELVETVWGFDGGADCYDAFSLSGEPVADQAALGRARKRQMNAQEIAKTNVAMRSYKKNYLDYWNSTEDISGTGQPVDAIICPAAACPAARPKQFRYVGYTSIYNLLDYTAAVFPVTTVNKNIDSIDKNFEAYNEIDRQTQDDYDPDVYDGAHVSLQLVGRRLQEEKVVALVEHVSDLLHTGSDRA